MFHENLRNLREDCNISQKQMSELLEIPVSTYRNYENTYREPSYDTLTRICEILQVSSDELLGIKKNDEKYITLFSKIKTLNSSKLQMLNMFVNFLISTK